MPDRIDRFDGEYRFLSNFWACRVVYGGIDYANAEAAFQAQKTVRDGAREKFASLKPGEAKRKGRNILLRPDWESVKRAEMARIVSAKFRQNGELGRKLLETGRAELIEGNDWNDTLWGVCRGSGQNWLGRILMALRQDMLSEQAGPSQSFRAVLRNIYGGACWSDAFVTLYGPDADTGKAKAVLSERLKASKKLLLYGPGNGTWDESSPLRHSLEEMQELTGVRYRIDAIAITDDVEA